MSYRRSPSYRSGGTKKTGFGNGFLIIVNGLVTITPTALRAWLTAVILLPKIRPVWGRVVQ
jgi:hypothetical protein